MISVCRNQLKCCLSLSQVAHRSANNDHHTEEDIFPWMSAGYTTTPEMLAVTSEAVSQLDQ